MHQSSAECRLFRIYEPTSGSSANSCMQHIQSKFNATLSHQLDSFKSFWIVRCHCELSTLGFNWLTERVYRLRLRTPRSHTTTSIVRVYGCRLANFVHERIAFSSVSSTALTHTHRHTDTQWKIEFRKTMSDWKVRGSKSTVTCSARVDNKNGNGWSRRRAIKDFLKSFFSFAALNVKPIRK